LTNYRKVDWADKAVCKGKGDMFFEAIWPDDENDWPLPSALRAARALCDSCPVRRPCIEEAMRVEEGTAAAFRFGVRAGLTPEQRRSLEASSWRCPNDGTVYDPATLRRGTGICLTCGSVFTRPPVPDEGDKWAPRHARLYKRCVTHFHNAYSVGSPVPEINVLAVEWGVRHNDVKRVYLALAEDGVIARQGSRWIRQSPTAARLAGSWQDVLHSGGPNRRLRLETDGAAPPRRRA